MYALVAQSVEQLPFKEMVVGSIPTEGTVNEVNMCARASKLLCLRVGIERLVLFVYKPPITRSKRDALPIDVKVQQE